MKALAIYLTLTTIVAVTGYNTLQGVAADYHEFHRNRMEVIHNI